PAFVRPEAGRIAGESAVRFHLMSGRELVGRLIGTIGTLLGVAVVVFIVLRALPGDTITAKFGTESASMTDSQLAHLESYYGLDEPLLVQFFGWLGNLLQGDLGVSLTTGNEVGELIGDAVPVTVQLALLALLIAVPAGVALGVL